MEMVGTTSLGTKESILAGVFERLNVPSEVDSDVDLNGQRDDNEDAPSDASGTAIENPMETTPPITSLHQGIYTPLVRLAPTLGPAQASYVYKGYRRSSASVSLEPEDTLFPSGTDEEALAAELREEEELNTQDRIAAEKNENKLWAEYGRRRTGKLTVMVNDVEEEYDGHELRFKLPGINSTVKSQVYVVDSDSGN